MIVDLIKSFFPFRISCEDYSDAARTKETSQDARLVEAVTHEEDNVEDFCTE